MNRSENNQMKNWKRKTLSFGLVLSLMVGSLFGSIGGAVAAPVDDLRAKITAVYTYLLAGEETGVVATAKNRVDTIYGTDNTGYAFEDAIYTKMAAAAGADPVRQSVFNFMLKFNSFTYDKSLASIETYSNTTEFTDLVTNLKTNANVTDPVNFSDVLNFYNQVQSATMSTVQSMSSFDSLTDLISFHSGVTSAVDSLLNADPATTPSKTGIAKVFKALGITAEDLLDSKMSLIASTGTDILAADLALGNAYRRMVTPPPSTPSDPTPTPTPAATLPEQASETAKEVIADLQAKLAGLPPGDVKAEQKKAEKAVENAIKETGKTKVEVVVTDGTAKPTINNTNIVNKAKEAKVLADSLNKDLEAAGGKKAKVEVTLDLGTTTANKTEVPLDKTLLDSLANEGVSTVAVEVNGVGVTVDTSEFGSDTTLNIEKKTKEQSGDTSTTPKVSDYYNFEFTSNDNEITNFKKPVELKLPVINTDDYDTDLLSIAKIVNDRLQMYGGIFDNNSVSVKRNSFSTYVIVENKVEFNDTASVNSWAGRSIEVAAAKGIIDGRGEGVFDPSADVTRAEFAKMLVTAFSLFAPDATESFEDVEATDWFAPYVTVAVSQGIVSGRSETSFDPNASITRQEMATMAARALVVALGQDGAEDAGTALNNFSDSDNIGIAYKASVALVAEQGIINGYNGKFDPTGITTRAQAAVVIKKLIDLI
mgnify:CR=1 FL=1